MSECRASTLYSGLAVLSRWEVYLVFSIMEGVAAKGGNWRLRYDVSRH